jgi:hypothetical protein
MKSDSLCDKTFFIVKYSIIVNIEGAVFLFAVLCLGSVNLWQAFVLGLINLTGLSLFIAGRFEKHIDRLALAVCKRVSKSKTLNQIMIRYM